LSGLFDCGRLGGCVHDHVRQNRSDVEVVAAERIRDRAQQGRVRAASTGSPMPFEPTGFWGSWMSTASVLIVDGTSRYDGKASPDTSPVGREPVLRVVDVALATRHAETHHTPALDLLRPRPCGCINRAAIRYAEVVDNVDLPGLRVELDLDEAHGNGRHRAGDRDVVLATPTRPVPAINAAADFVTAWMSCGNSLPLNLPPSSIARCAAAA